MNEIIARKPRNDTPSMWDAFDRMLDTMWTSSPFTGTSPGMPLDVYEKDGLIYFRAAIPGIRPEDIEVSVDGDLLTIRGEAKQTWETDEHTKVYRREFRQTNYLRSIRLPEGLDLEKLDAQFENGMVTVTVPKVEPTKTEPRRIPVRPSNAVVSEPKNAPTQPKKA